MKKELCLELLAAERELTEAINNTMQEHELPCYLLEPIVEKLLRAVRSGKEQEIAAATRKEQSDE